MADINDYKKRWTELLFKLKDVESEFIRVYDLEEDVRVAAKEAQTLRRALNKYSHGSNHGVITYSLSKLIGGQDRVALLSGAVADFLGASVDVYDLVVEGHEQKKGRPTVLRELGPHGALSLYTRLIMLANKGISMIGKMRGPAVSAQLVHVVDRYYSHMLLSDRVRENVDKLPTVEEAYAIVDGISEYGKMLGLLAAIPVAWTDQQIELSAEAGKNMCAALHTAEEVRDFLTGEDIQQRKLANPVFAHLAELLDEKGREELEEKLKRGRLSDKTVKKIRQRAIEIGAVDVVVNKIRHYISSAERDVRNLPGEDEESRKFLLDSFRYMGQGLDEMTRRYKTDGSFGDKLKDFLKRGAHCMAISPTLASRSGNDTWLSLWPFWLIWWMWWMFWTIQDESEDESN
jgi:geranylgeranyl pyrophosphate synthase